MVIKLYISNNVAERIKHLAKNRGISVKSLLDGVGLGFNTMSNMKSSMPKADNLAKIADYLDCSVDYLLGRTSSNLPVELLQQAITNEKTLGDVMASFAKLPANRQAALSLIISDMEVRQMIDTYSKTGDSKWFQSQQVS